MYSSRMRTVRSSGRLSGPGGGGVSALGVSALGGLLPGGVCGIPACTEADIPPRVDRQTPVKT